MEREADLERLEAVVDAARSGAGRVAVVEGEPGIGKTALLRALTVRAAPKGLQVLHASGSELEHGLGFGVVRQLFAAVVGARPEDRERLVRGAAGFAVPALGLEPAAGGGPNAPLEAQHGLYWLAANMAADDPLLLVVDDAQWSDAPSLRWLVYLARRLEDLPLGLVVAWRSGEPATPVELLERLRAEASPDSLAPSPLSTAATAQLVRARLPDADDAFCAACHDATGGNPFLLDELVSAAAQADIELTTEAATRLRELGPRAVQRAVFLRLARLPREAIAVARAAAVLDADANLGTLARLAELDVETSARMVSLLAQARIFATGDPPAFAHPVLRAAVYGDLEPSLRALEHRRAAAIIHECADTEERAAVHLLRTSPAGDTWVANVLAEAAQRALRRGAFESAWALLNRALAEPAPAAERASLLLSRGLAAWQSGTGDPDADLRAAARDADDGFMRASAWGTLARMHVARRDWAQARAALDAAISAVPIPDSDFARTLSLLRVTGRLAAGDAVTDVASDARSLQRRLEAGSPLARLCAGLSLFAEVARPDGPRKASISRLVDTIGDPTELAHAFEPDFVGLHFPLIALGYVDRHGDANAALDVIVERGRRAARASWALGNRAWQRFHLGDLAGAESDAWEMLSLADATDDELLRFNALGWLCLALADRGSHDHAEAALAAAGLSRALSDLSGQDRLFLYGRAALRSSQGKHDLARADVEQFFDLNARTGAGAFGPVIAGCARLLALAGAETDARATASAAVAASSRAGIRGARGMALHAQALTESRADMTSALEEAIVELEKSPLRLEHARALVDHGAALRRANRRAEAREPLARGMELAHRLGAAALVERARQELRATGARPRRVVLSGVDSLTASERRVADLAASGLRIDDIAQALFVTRKTVETHLYSSYRKLDVDSREGLARALQQAD